MTARTRARKRIAERYRPLAARALLTDVGVDKVPVDVVAETWQLRHVDHAVGVHRIDWSVQPRRRGVVVDERMQETALIEARNTRRQRAHCVQVANAAAVDLHLHAERLGEMANLHQWRESANIANAATDDVARASFDPVSPREHLSLDCLRTTDGQRRFRA